MRVIVAGYKDLSNSLWTAIRIHASSMEMSEGPGRGIRGLVGFYNKNGFRLLGFCVLLLFRISLCFRFLSKLEVMRRNFQPRLK